MKITKREFVVYGADGVAHMVTTEKAQAINVAQQIWGTVRLRITTVKECEPLDKDYTVWA